VGLFLFNHTGVEMTLEIQTNTGNNIIELLGVAELCQRLKMTRRRLDYLQEAGYIPPPQKAFGGRRIYTIDDINKISSIEETLRMRKNK
jgi:hypothetical protein